MATTKTRFAKASKEGFDCLMKYFETDELSHLTKAIEAFRKAESDAGTARERFFAGRMRTVTRLLAP